MYGQLMSSWARTEVAIAIAASTSITWSLVMVIGSVENLGVVASRLLAGGTGVQLGGALERRQAN